MVEMQAKTMTKTMGQLVLLFSESDGSGWSGEFPLFC